MHTFALAIVLVSTATHAYWNFLVKRAAGGPAFIGLSKVAESVCFAPFFVWMMLGSPLWRPAAILLVAGGAALVLLNYAALDRAYALGDLSLVYPISRAGILLFLPALGFLVFDERLTATGWTALAFIVIGIGVLQLPAFSRAALRTLVPQLRTASVAYALGAALFAALYTVWDKRAVRELPAFVYFYAYTSLVAAAYALYLWRARSPGEVRRVWRSSWPSILQVAVFNTVTYLLVLVALRDETSSYVVALRQLSIVWGALLGHTLLGEALPPPKRTGIAMLVAGCALVALAR